MKRYSRQTLVLLSVLFVLACTTVATSTSPPPLPTQTEFSLPPVPVPVSTATPEKSLPSPTFNLQTEIASSSGFTVHGSMEVCEGVKLFWEILYAKDTIQIEVECNDLGSSIESVIKRETDVGLVHRELTQSELAGYPDLQVRTGCWAAIAIVAHPDVPVRNLTTDQVWDIFSGRTSNWSELGGEPESIVVATYVEGSANQYVFLRPTLGENTIVDTAWTASHTANMRTLISTTPSSIGYLPLGALNDTVKTISINGVEPTIENVTSGEYPLSIPLNLVTNGEPSETVNAWLSFIYSEEGQAIIAEQGYIPAQ